jgi:hypothetical protein
MLPQVADFNCLQIDWLSANMFEKQFRIVNEGWSSGLGFQRGANDPNRKKPTFKKKI